MVFKITNTHYGVLDWCKSFVGKGSVVEVKNTPSNPRRLRTYHYNLDSKTDIFNLLVELLPYLQIKKPQALLALEFIRMRQGTPRNSAFKPEELDILFEMRVLNQKRYDKAGAPYILYRGVPYTKQQFNSLLLSSRNGPHYRTVQWTPAMDAKLGTTVDRIVAKDLGLKLAQVQRRRTALRIPAIGS
jgi:hypothetical protein